MGVKYRQSINPCQSSCNTFGVRHSRSLSTALGVYFVIFYAVVRQISLKFLYSVFCWLVKLFFPRLVVPEEVMAGTGIPGGGGRGRLFLTIHCHHQSNDEIHF